MIITSLPSPYMTHNELKIYQRLLSKYIELNFKKKESCDIQKALDDFNNFILEMKVKYD